MTFENIRLRHDCLKVLLMKILKSQCSSIFTIHCRDRLHFLRMWDRKKKLKSQCSSIVTIQSHDGRYF